MNTENKIIFAIRLFGSGIVIGLFALAVNEGYLYYLQTLGFPDFANNLKAQGPYFYYEILFYIFFSAFLLYKISKHKNWARIILAAFYILGVFNLMYILLSQPYDGPHNGLMIFMQVSGVLKNLMQGWALWLLFSSPVKNLFRQVGHQI